MRLIKKWISLILYYWKTHPILAISMIYFTAASVVILANDSKLIVFDVLLIIAMALVLVIAKKKFNNDFLKDWIPLILLLVGYEYMRTIVPNMLDRALYVEVANLERAIFGTLPTIELQKLLYNPNRISWYDFVFTTLYVTHFVAPFVFGLFLWIKKRSAFHKFALALIILSYSAFITYYFLPSSPPWLTSQFGYIPKIVKVQNEVYTEVMAFFNIAVKGVNDSLSFYNYVGGNPVAAIPSLHASYPLLIFLFVLKFFKKYIWIPLIYMITVWFSIVYIGEHYIVDVLAGIMFTIASFLTANYLLRNRRLERINTRE